MDIVDCEFRCAAAYAGGLYHEDELLLDPPCSNYSANSSVVHHFVHLLDFQAISRKNKGEAGAVSRFSLERILNACVYRLCIGVNDCF